MADVTYLRDREILDAFGRDIVVSNNVRLNKDGSVIRTTYGVPYKPQHFPAGHWHITGAEPETGHLAPFAVLTDAWQMVEEWALTKDGAYDHPTGHMVKDSHYWIHYSDLDFTFGCIRVVREEDLRWLVTQVKAELAQLHALNPDQAWISMEA